MVKKNEEETYLSMFFLALSRSFSSAIICLLASAYCLICTFHSSSLWDLILTS